jgi:hypothetical protein
MTFVYENTTEDTELIFIFQLECAYNLLFNYNYIINNNAILWNSHILRRKIGVRVLRKNFLLHSNCNKKSSSNQISSFSKSILQFFTYYRARYAWFNISVLVNEWSKNTLLMKKKFKISRRIVSYLLWDTSSDSLTKENQYEIQLYLYLYCNQKQMYNETASFV